MINQGPFTLTQGQTLSLQPPGGQPNWDRIIVTNATPWACKVDAGAGPAPWLNPWTEQVYTLAPGAIPAITPVYANSGASSDSNLAVTWLLASDELQGDWPVSLTSQAVAATVAGALSVVNASGTSLSVLNDESLLVTMAATATTATVTPPANSQCLRIVVPGTTIQQIVGTSSGQAVPMYKVPWTGYWVAEIDPSLDASYTVTLNGTPSGKWWVIATLATEVVTAIPPSCSLSARVRVPLGGSTTTTSFGPGALTTVYGLVVTGHIGTSPGLGFVQVVDSGIGGGSALWEWQLGDEGPFSSGQIIPHVGYTLAGQLELVVSVTGTGAVSASLIY